MSIAKSNSSFDIAVIGSGPAGLMAAAGAARAGKQALLIECMGKVGGKIPVTGGGHCNMSAMVDEKVYYEGFGRQGRFISDALRRLGPSDLIDFFAEIGVPCIEDATGKIFPASGKAKDVVDALSNLMTALGVKLWLNSSATALEVEGGKIAAVQLGDGRRALVNAAIICCGGKSYPGLGSRGDGYRLAGQLGHDIVKPRCALAGLHISKPKLSSWAGLTLGDVELSFPQKRKGRKVYRSSVVVTHVGLSGPAAMDISTHASAALDAGSEHFEIELNFTPDISAQEWIDRVNAWRASDGAKNLLTLTGSVLGRSIGGLVLELSGIDYESKAAHAPKDAAERIAVAATASKLYVSGVDGFDKAMVTAGGVSLKQVNPRTLESKLVNGLYFAGEVLDLDGPTGGYNLQWAFSSGLLAGESAAAII